LKRDEYVAIGEYIDFSPENSCLIAETWFNTDTLSYDEKGSVAACVR